MFAEWEDLEITAKEYALAEETLNVILGMEGVLVHRATKEADAAKNARSERMETIAVACANVSMEENVKRRPVLACAHLVSLERPATIVALVVFTDKIAVLSAIAAPKVNAIR